MVGGGQGAFIGNVHRIAARMDDQWDLVAGAFSSDPARSAASAADLGIAPDRAYPDFATMARIEAGRGDGIDAVAVVTPNHLHAEPAVVFLNAGINVICDKPLAATLADAERIEKVASTSKARFFLTHNYTGYPLVRQARELIKKGELGAIRLIQVEYLQDWLTVAVSSKQADWRTNPEATGGAGCIADIGTHAYNLACYISDMLPTEISADLGCFVEGRRVDDNAIVNLRYGNGARGMLWTSQVAPGNENGLRIRVYGDRAGLEWAQENPNVMHVSPFGAPRYTLTRGGVGNGNAGMRNLRVPAGHPEGYLEAFATIYSEAARSIRTDRGELSDPEAHAPTVSDGLNGVRFVGAAIESSANNSAWIHVRP